MEDLKKAWEELKTEIASCSPSGIHGAKVADLKNLAAKVDEELKKFDEEEKQ